MPRKKSRVRAWIPTGLLVAGILAFTIAAISFGNSWWTAEDHRASDDQAARNGTSLFTSAGVDYWNVTRVVKVKLREDAAGATQLGLPTTGSTSFDALTPVEVRVLGLSGVLDVDLVDTITLITADDRVSRLEFDYASDGSYRDTIAVLRDMAPNCGWTDEDFQALTDALTASSSASKGTYSATLTASEKLGFPVSAVVTVDPKNAFTSLRIVAEAP